MTAFPAIALLAMSACQVDVELAKSVRDAFQRNVEKLESGTLHFRACYATPKTLEAARSGEYDREFKSEPATYLFHKNRVKYECLFSTEQELGSRYPSTVTYTSKVEAEKQKGAFQQKVRSARYCTDGKLWLCDTCRINEKKKEYFHDAMIVGDSQWTREFVHCPLRLGHVGPARSQLILCIEGAMGSNKTDNSKAGSYELTGSEKEFQLDGGNFAKLSFVSPGNAEMKFEFWIDMARGAVPVRYLMSFLKTNAFMEYNNSDLREVKPGAWFPYRETLIAYDGNKGRVGMARSFEVERADFTTPPPASEILALNYATPVKCSDMVRKTSFAKQKRWRLDALPAVTAAGAVGFRSEPAMAVPTKPGERPAPGFGWWIYAAAAIVIVAAIGAAIKWKNSR